MSFRSLTPQEVALARRIFANSIAYEKVTVTDGRFHPFHPRGTGMAPNGHLYMYGCHLADYAAGTPAQQAFFIHEMTHVWQRQNKVLCPIASALALSLRNVFRYHRSYPYILQADKDLADYNMEQQACILQDYFLHAFCGAAAATGRCKNAPGNWPETRPLYEAVLKRFLADPGYAGKTQRPSMPRHPSSP